MKIAKRNFESIQFSEVFGGVRAVVTFTNGYGASIIKTKWSYGVDEDEIRNFEKIAAMF